MSAVLPKIIAPSGLPYIVDAKPKLDISRLPSIWQIPSEIEWLINGIIPRRSVNLISADSGTGKTWLAYAIAGAVARGTNFIGQTVNGPTPVLYLDGENPAFVAKRNLTDLGIGETDQLRVWGGWNEEAPPGPNDDRIIRYAEDAKPLLIWDSLVEFAEGDEQSSTEMRGFMKHFRALAHSGATVIVLHHTGKSQGAQKYRGSSDIKASVDMAYLVTGSPKDGKLHRLTMDPFKSRIAPGLKFAMEFQEGQGFTGIATPGEVPRPDAKAVIDRIVLDKPGLNGGQIVERARDQGISKHKAEEILKLPCYRIEKRKGNEKLYFISEPGPSPDLPDPAV